MNLRSLLFVALIALSGCLEPVIQTDSLEFVGGVEGTSAFAALRILPDNRVEAYLCDGQGEEPTIQAWLSGFREGNEVSLASDNPYLGIRLNGTLVNEEFDGFATISGEEHHVTLLGATRPDGLYNVTFEDGLRRGWIVIDGEERGPAQTLFRSNPVAFNDGSMVNVTASGVVKLKTRFTANMLDGFTSTSLAPGRFMLEIVVTEPGDGVIADDVMMFHMESVGVKLRSASTNQVIDLVHAPQLSSPNRAVFTAAPSLFSATLPLVDVFTVEMTGASNILSSLGTFEEFAQSRILTVRM